MTKCKNFDFTEKKIKGENYDEDKFEELSDEGKVEKMRKDFV